MARLFRRKELLYLRRIPRLSVLNYKHETCMIVRYGVTGNAKTDQIISTVTAGRAERWLQSYEDFVGLTDVKEAQNNVIEAEGKFSEAQAERRIQQQHLTTVQNELQVLNKQLEKLQRGDEKYLELVQQEVRIFKQQDEITAALTVAEKTEREYFAELSSAVRESHEKERARAERTKYWSIIGSAVGALIGIFGTTINNYLRMRELRGLVSESAGSGTKLKTLVGELSEKLQYQQNQMNLFVGDLRAMFSNDKDMEANIKKSVAQMPVSRAKHAEFTTEQLEEHTKQILQLVKKQDISLRENIKDMKHILASASVQNKEGDVVYIGPEIREMLEENESNVEQKLKLNALWTVTFVYGAFALTLPALYYIFKGT